MPAIVTLPDVQPTDVRRGDQLDVPGFGPVATIDRKVRYVYFTDVDGKTLRRDIAVPLTVERSVKTSEEEAAEIRELSIAQLTRQMERVLADTTIAQITDQMADGAFTDHWDIERLVAAQAERRIWCDVHRFLANIAKGVVEPTYRDWTIYDVVAHMVADYTTSLLTTVAAGTSRSSNTMANAVEDVERAAKATFVRDFTRYSH
jgi:ribosomal protein L29